MKCFMTITAVAFSTALLASTANADTVDANNPNVTNERVDADGERDIQSRFDKCSELQGSLPTNATEDQLGAFDTQCAEFGTATGQLSLPQNATEQQIKQ
jgi:hypothetical protein